LLATDGSYSENVEKAAFAFFCFYKIK